MINDMGIFRTNIEIASGADPSRRMELRDVMVDTGSEYNWIPGELLVALGVAPVRIDRFETADGRILERPVGLAYIFAGGRSAATMVVFSNPGEMVLLGAHGMEGLNLRVDLSRRELIPAGPMPVAAAAWTSCFPGRQLGFAGSVAWVNCEPTAIPHTSTADDGAWNSASLAPAASFTRAFPAAGSFPCHCAIHLSMKQTVFVD